MDDKQNPALEVHFAIDENAPLIKALNTRYTAMSERIMLDSLKAITFRWHLLGDGYVQSEAEQEAMDDLVALFGNRLHGRFGCKLMYLFSPDGTQMEAWYEIPSAVLGDIINRFADPGCLFTLKGTKEQIDTAKSILCGAGANGEPLGPEPMHWTTPLGNSGWILYGIGWTNKTYAETRELG